MCYGVHCLLMSAPIFLRMTEALQAAGYETSLSAIGRLFGVYPSAVTKWRDGDALPELRKLLDLVEITGCSAEWLLTGEGSRVSKVDDITKALLKIWASLSEEDRKAVLDFVKYKASQPPPTPAK